MNDTIHHNQDENRFESEVDGHQSVLDYSFETHQNKHRDSSCEHQTVSMNRVLVPDAVGGRGIAGELTRFALDHARSHGWKIIPRCPYVKTWIERHPDYADLQA